MGKKMIALVMVVGLVVMGLVAVAIPKGVQADRIYPIDWEWSGAAFVGYDSFYDTNVVAYQEGDTAHLTAQVRNYLPGGGTPGDATIQSAVVKFEWGEEYAASNVPAEIGENEYATLDFEFTVPNVDVATNALLHSYEIIVTYQTQGAGYVVNQVNWQFQFNGNDSQVNAYLTGGPVDEDSVEIYRVNNNADPPTITGLLRGTDYTLDSYNGNVVLADAPDFGYVVYATYVYLSELDGVTDGYNTNFATGQAPIVADSEGIFIANTVTGSVSETTDYSIDNETGKVTLGAAPQSYEQVWGTWEYYQDSTDWGYSLGAANFAVYTDGQADARQLRDLYNDMDRPAGGLISDILAGSAAGSQAELEAEALATLGNTEYDKGSFEAAAGYYQDAIDKMNEAIAADTLIGTGTEEVLDGIGTGAGDWLDGQAEKGQAQAEKLKAEAGFADMYGIFIIMAGAGIILVSAGFIVWGVSRLVAARRM